jgi:N utilization substance protein B
VHPDFGSKVVPSARRKARKLCVQALYQWQMTRDDVQRIDNQFCEDNDLRKTDAGYFKELLHQIPANVTELDGYFEPFLDRRREELDQVELAILRISTYELAKRPDIPYRVVINEGIELAKTFGATDSHKYVNGVLDRVAGKLRAPEIREHYQNRS